MKITTKLMSLLGAFVVFSGDASNLGGLPIPVDVLHAMDKGVVARLRTISKDGSATLVNDIDAQLDKCGVTGKDVLDALGSKVEESILEGVNVHQERITPKALTGDVEYTFFYGASGEQSDSIKRRDITNLLGQMAEVRLKQDDINKILTTDDGVDRNKYAPSTAEYDRIANANKSLMTKIVRLIKCLSQDALYKKMWQSSASTGIVEKDFLHAAHVIMKAAYADHYVAHSPLAALQQIAKGSDEDGVNLLKPGVLQAFTTLLFLQRTPKANNGAVKDLSEYLITRGNAIKVMQDTGGKLLLCDDISLELSGLYALGLKPTDAAEVIGSDLLDIDGDDAYVLPAAVLLDEKTGVPVVGTPVIPAPYLEYAINNGKLPPANNIIVDSTDGVKSVLTTYGTLLRFVPANTAKTVTSCVSNNNTDNAHSLSADGFAGTFVPSAKIADDATKIFSDTQIATSTDGTKGAAQELEEYGNVTATVKDTTFAFHPAAATMIMNSLLSHKIVKTDSKTGIAPVDNVATGPFYAARILADYCPDTGNTPENTQVYDSTAAVMLCSAKDSGIRSLKPKDKMDEVAVGKDIVAKRIATVSECLIPGFDVDSKGDYVVTGLDATEITDMDGSRADKLVSDAVLKDKGSKLLAAISSISKGSK